LVLQSAFSQFARRSLVRALTANEIYNLKSDLSVTGGIKPRKNEEGEGETGRNAFSLLRALRLLVVLIFLEG